MNNVIPFKPPTPPKTIMEMSMEFIGDFMAWAAEHDIDVTTTDFKYDAAIVMTTVQSMLLRSGRVNEDN